MASGLTSHTAASSRWLFSTALMWLTAIRPQPMSTYFMLMVPFYSLKISSYRARSFFSSTPQLNSSRTA